MVHPYSSGCFYDPHIKNLVGEEVKKKKATERFQSTHSSVFAYCLSLLPIGKKENFAFIPHVLQLSFNPCSSSPSIIQKSNKVHPSSWETC